MKITQQELHAATQLSDFEQRYSLRSFYSPEEFRSLGLDPFAVALPCWYHGGFLRKADGTVKYYIGNA